MAFKSASRPLIRDNLIAYFLTNQVAALAEAQTQLGYAGTLTPLTNFYTSSVGRILTTFPHGMCVMARTQEAEVTYGRDSYEAWRHTYLFELEIYGTSAAQLTKDTEGYCTAFTNVCLNIPKATVANGIQRVAGLIVRVTSEDPDQLRGQSTTSPPSDTGNWTKAPQITVQVDLIEGR
jgi:hypothetical protein